jgi:hypothetical protein
MQATPLAHEHQYFIDCALESGEISAACHNALSLWADAGRVDAVIESEGRPRAGWRKSRKAICLALEDYALALLLSRPAHVQRAAMACALIHARQVIVELAEFAADWNFEDATTGGVWLCDDEFWPTPRALRRLMSPRAIRRYVKLDDSSIRHARDIADRLRRLPWPETLQEAGLILDLLNGAREELRRKHEIAAREIAERVFARERRAPYRIIRRERRAQRKTIVRAAGIAAALLGASTVSAFARGEPVALHGETMTLEARAARGLGTVGHGACALTLRSPEGVELGKLCCFFEKTPALDQLAAFALHMAVGEERAVLDAGNLYSLRPEAIAHPLLAERIGRLAAAAEQMRPTRHERQRAAKVRYFAGTRDVYVEAVREFIWGRDARRLARLVGGR